MHPDRDCNRYYCRSATRLHVINLLHVVYMWLEPGSRYSASLVCCCSDVRGRSFEASVQRQRVGPKTGDLVLTREQRQLRTSTICIRIHDDCTTFSAGEVSSNSYTMSHGLIIVVWKQSVKQASSAGVIPYAAPIGICAIV